MQKVDALQTERRERSRAWFYQRGWLSFRVIQWPNDERPAFTDVKCSSDRPHTDQRREFTMILPFIAFAVLAILGLSCVVAPFVGSQQ